MCIAFIKVCSNIHLKIYGDLFATKMIKKHQVDVFDVNQFFCDNWNAKDTVQNLNECCVKPCRKKLVQ